MKKKRLGIHHIIQLISYILIITRLFIFYFYLLFQKILDWFTSFKKVDVILFATRILFRVQSTKGYVQNLSNCSDRCCFWMLFLFYFCVIECPTIAGVNGVYFQVGYYSNNDNLKRSIEISVVLIIWAESIHFMQSVPIDFWRLQCGLLFEFCGFSK